MIPDYIVLLIGINMSLEFHGYIIDPKKRSLDLTQLTTDVNGYHIFGKWEIVNDEMRCSAGWITDVEEHCYYLLAQQGDLLVESWGGLRKPITWTGSAPTNNVCVIL